jgi:hypothetical protein
VRSSSYTSASATCPVSGLVKLVFKTLGLAVRLIFVVLVFSSSNARAQMPTLPHDPDLLEKLYQGDFSQIADNSAGRMDLLAVFHGFADLQCSIQDKRGLDTSPEEMMNIQRYLTSDTQATYSSLFVTIHPNYQRTGLKVAETGGCEGKWAQRTLKNFYRLIEQRAETERR